MHANVFYLLVERQAGTRAKALIESVMNSADAGSPSVEITLSERWMTITDKGRGFTDDDEVKRFFSTVGTPHVAGDAEFGRYRMGRLQLFRWGNNQWRSNGFRFDVDVKGRGKEHDIHRGLEHHPGCAITVELYDPMTRAEVSELETTLAEWTAFSRMAVIVNGKQVSRDPSLLTDWTLDDPEAWIRLDDSSQLRLYNKGIFVKAFSAAEFGAGGVVSTKDDGERELDLIYARNDVHTRCPLWRALRARIKAQTTERSRRRGLTADQRAYHCTRLLSGELTMSEAISENLRLFTTVDGTHHTLERYATMASEGIGMAEATDPKAVSVHRNKVANVLDAVTVERCAQADPASLASALAAPGATPSCASGR